MIWLGLMLSLLASLLIAACTSDSDCSSSGTGRTVIDWVDFIKFDGITYWRLPAEASSPIDADDLGAPFAEVPFKVSDEVTDPRYRTKDGDATFLEIGTVVYRLSDYEPSFRLAVPPDGDVRIYEAA
jgi:hypothetical protein